MRSEHHSERCAHVSAYNTKGTEMDTAVAFPNYDESGREMSKGDFLPMKAEELQQRLPEINRRLMEGLILLPEELRELPVEGDCDDYVAHGERIIEHHMEHVEQIEMALGALLIAIRTKYGKEKWYEALGRLGISPRKAQILMKNTRDFGDHPELVEGMGYRKMERLGALPDAYLDELSGHTTPSGSPSSSGTGRRRSPSPGNCGRRSRPMFSGGNRRTWPPCRRRAAPSR